MGEFTARDGLTVAVIAITLAAGGAWSIGVDVAGTVVAGEVVDKHEAIVMPLHDTWRHSYEITYRYRPPGAALPATGRHGVDVALYDALRVGASVKVRSVEWPFLGVFGRQSAIDGTSWRSRQPQTSESARELVDVIAMVVVGVLGFVAYRRGSRPLGLIAGTAAAALASSIVLVGGFVFPLLFWAWRANRRKGFGWVLLGSIGLTAPALWYRVPWPPPLLTGAEGRGTATVRDVRLVDQIWASSSKAGESLGGEPIWQPFQMVDLEFTPAERAAPVHAMDRVDLDSVPGLKPGATVPVVYARADPRGGRMAIGTRRYGERIALYVFGLTFGLGAVVAFVVLPIGFLVRWLGGRLVRSNPVLRAAFDPVERARLLSALPEDDPRRESIRRRLK